MILRGGIPDSGTALAGGGRGLGADDVASGPVCGHRQSCLVEPVASPGTSSLPRRRDDSRSARFLVQ